jgi:DNA-directed RNA polymerase specialized sigma subunit
MYDERTHTLDEIAKVIGVSRSAVARSIYAT